MTGRAHNSTLIGNMRAAGIPGASTYSKGTVFKSCPAVVLRYMKRRTRSGQGLG
jgi:hypothetical protein